MAMEQNLFGPSVSDIRNQMAQADAQWGNNLTSTGLAASIGGMAGRGIGGLMGLEDPRETEAKAVQEAVQELRSSGVDMNDPVAYFKKIAAVFGSKGLTKQAEMAAAKALEYETKAEERAYKKELHGIDYNTKLVGLEKAYVELAKEKAKASGKMGAPELEARIQHNFANASPESKVKAWQIFNGPNGSVEKALEVLASSDKDRRATSFTSKEGVWILDPEEAKKPGAKVNPNHPDYVFGGLPKDPMSVQVSPTIRTAADLERLHASVEQSIKPYQDVVDAADAFESQADMATTNSAAANATRSAFARMFRPDTNMAASEVQNLVNVGGFPVRFQASLVKFLNGTMTEEVLRDMKAAVAAMKRQAQAKIDARVSRAARMMNSEGNNVERSQYVGSGRGNGPLPVIPSVKDTGAGGDDIGALIDRHRTP